MKRVKSACLMQTLHFVLDPKLTREEGIERVKKEVEDYKSLMGYQL